MLTKNRLLAEVDEITNADVIFHDNAGTNIMAKLFFEEYR